MRRGAWSADGRGRSMSTTLLTIALVVLIAALILRPFRRRIGGPDGGSEKASVGAWWVIAGIVVAILMSR